MLEICMCLHILTNTAILLVFRHGIALYKIMQLLFKSSVMKLPI